MQEDFKKERLNFLEEIFRDPVAEFKKDIEKLKAEDKKGANKVQDAFEGDTLADTEKQDEEEAAKEEDIFDDNSYYSHRKWLQTFMEEKWGDLGGLAEDKLIDLAIEVINYFSSLVFHFLDPPNYQCI